MTAGFLPFLARRRRMTPRLSASVFVLLFLWPGHAADAWPQEAGAVAGYVTDPTGLPVTGVVVTAFECGRSGAPPSTRTDSSGFYTLKGLPPGPCTIGIEFAGFVREERAVTVRAGATVTLDTRLDVAPIPQSVKVTAEVGAESPHESPPGEVTFPGDEMDRVPVGRTPEDAALMAPGVTATGPNGALTMAGAFSYGNLFLVDGFPATENTRGLSRPFHIGDAVQETRVSTGNVPVEYGRFQGGVLNTITRSGGNTVGASVRIGVTSDGWRALTPYRGDTTLNQRVPTWEAWVGGPLVRNRIYYFAAAMRARSDQSRSLAYTQGSYAYRDEERKYQVKATWTPSKSHTLKGEYFRVNSSRANVNSGVVMDLASLYDNESPESLVGLSYNAVLRPRLLLEARYSRRTLTYSGSGSSDTNLRGGTPIWDRSRSDARFNSPFGCAVCPGAEDARNGQDGAAKLWFSVPTRRWGVHEVTTGLDVYQESRFTNAYQSGSGFRVRATKSVVSGSQVFPVFLPDRTTWIYWTPILKNSVGNDLRTYSAFAADTWRLSPRFTVKAGLRVDLNDDRDSIGARAVRATAWSPRVGAMWDPTGSGQWLLNLGWARYVTAINGTVADAASPGGRPATYVFDYLGPAVNPDGTKTYTSPQDALQVLFNWFTASPGVNRATRSAPSIPGVNVGMDPALGPLDTHEFSGGFTRQLGRRGTIRVDLVYRRFLDFYATRRDMTTGRVTDPAGTRLDAMVVTNATTDVERSYKGLLTQLTFRPLTRVQVSASYTLSSTFGNVDGEDANVGPTMVTLTDYPEYRNVDWSAPIGPLGTDQRHRLRLWATWDVKIPAPLGRLTIGLVQRVESGAAWSATGNINPSAYVKNPGYVTPPSSVPYYFSPRGGYRNGTVTATDLSANWTRRLPGLAKGQVFFRGMLANVFNQSTAVRVNRTILTRNDSVAYQAFNPFTQAPVSGVNYGYGPDFGKPIGPGDYQTPREFSISFGMRR